MTDWEDTFDEIGDKHDLRWLTDKVKDDIKIDEEFESIVANLKE